ncbi:MAG: hypothetical protein Fur006_62020 [Coleofasciculaceae cyanobacterium]
MLQFNEDLTMAFLKIGTLVVNTAYIAAVNLESKTISGVKSVSLLVAIPKFILLEAEVIPQNYYYYEWLEFTGKEAEVLKDHFSSFNNVIDLLPNYQETAVS